MRKKEKDKETFIVLIPSYNEAKIIEKVILEWSEIIKRFPGSEILVIDSSNDETYEILEKLKKKFKFLKIVRQKPLGHGKAILEGYQKALKTKHTWIFQTDADGYFKVKDFYKLWDKRNTSGLILGYRERRTDPLFRLVLTWTTKIWVLILFGKYIKDSNIPFRLIRRCYLKEIIKKIPHDVFAPNIFLSIMAAKDNHKLYDIPVSHSKEYQTKQNGVKIFKGATKTFIELTLFRLRI